MGCFERLCPLEQRPLVRKRRSNIGAMRRISRYLADKQSSHSFRVPSPPRAPITIKKEPGVKVEPGFPLLPPLKESDKWSPLPSLERNTIYSSGPGPYSTPSHHNPVGGY